jgi:hypothetical protein
MFIFMDLRILAAGCVRKLAAFAALIEGSS